jgi:hypothetical protein
MNSESNFTVGDNAFFGETVCENGTGPVKKIQDAIVHVSKPYPQFVDIVSQIIGVRSTELVAPLCQAFNLCNALVSGSFRHRSRAIQPGQKWA